MTPAASTRSCQQYAVLAIGALLVSSTGSIQHNCVTAAASDAVAEGGCWPAGGIGSSFALQVLCAPGTDGQNPLLPTNISIPPITFDITVELCPQGSEERGILCQPCDLNFYNYNSTSCQACPEGECRHLRALRLASLALKCCQTLLSIE